MFYQTKLNDWLESVALFSQVTTAEQRCDQRRRGLKYGGRIKGSFHMPKGNNNYCKQRTLCFACLFTVVGSSNQHFSTSGIWSHVADRVPCLRYFSLNRYAKAG